MTPFVLVPGAWLGGFAWERVCAPLLDAGHDVRPLTLSGLGNLSDATDVTLRTHVADIVSVLEEADLHDVVLVGHGCAGIPVGQAALEVRDRLRHVVHVDSRIARDGRSFVDGFGAEGRRELVDTIDAHHGCWPLTLTHDDFVAQGLGHGDIHLIQDWSKPHPGRTLTDPAELVGDLADLPSTYVKCLLAGPEPTDDVTALLASPHWQLKELATGHWPMYSAPAELAQILLALD